MKCGCGREFDPEIMERHCSGCGIRRAPIDDRYQPLKRLGAGNFGQVYLCQDRRLVNQVWAVKIFAPQEKLSLPQQQEMKTRFQIEAQQTAALCLKSSHIVKVTDSGQDATYGLFYVMEFLPGMLLSDYLHHPKEMEGGFRSVGLRKTLEITEQICQGLLVAHEHNPPTVHRDLKPQNIFLTWEHGEHHVKLLDFGLAKVLHPSARLNSSTNFGTLKYAAPEQINGQNIDGRTDLYALATIVYLMLTGRTPFGHFGNDETTFKRAVLLEPPPSMRLIRPDLDLPQDVERVVTKALAKNPEHRQSSVREFWDELQLCYQAPKYVGGVLVQQLRQEQQRLQTHITSLTKTLSDERETTNQEKEQLQSQLSAKSREIAEHIARFSAQQQELSQNQHTLSKLQQTLKAKEEALATRERELAHIMNSLDNQLIPTLTAREHELAEEKQRAKATEQKLQQTEGTLHQLQEKLRHTEAELRKQREQPTLPAPIPVVPPKPTAPAIRKKPEPTTPQRTGWGHLAIASLLLVLLAWGGAWLAAAWRKSGSQTQPVAAQKTDPPPRPADPRPASRSEETRPAARPAETRKPEPPPCYIDKTDSQPRATLASYAKTDAGRKFIEQSHGLRCTKLVRIPKGTLMLGSPNSDNEADNDEKPQYRVRLSRDFAMWKTEITQQEFQDVMGYNPSNNQGCPTCPVENVSWHEAVAYSLKLSLRIGLISSEDQGCFSCTGTGKDVTCSLRNEYEGKKYYTCPGFRLPTEAEWEYAARGGKSEPRYGNLGDIAWYGGNSGNKTQPVCTKTSTPHPYGLCDILGNVWEWTWDWYQRYPNSLKRSLNVDPVGPKTGSRRVERGGSYFYGARIARAAFRPYDDPSRRLDNLGFRILLSLSE